MSFLLQYLIASCSRPTSFTVSLDCLLYSLQHWPVAFDSENPTTELFPLAGGDEVRLDTETSIVDTWRAVVALLKTGKVKSVGVTDFSTAMVDAITEATGKAPAVNQVSDTPCI
jgi:L-glyceraldehyde reductase